MALHLAHRNELTDLMVNILPLFLTEKHLQNSCELQPSHLVKGSTAFPQVESVVVDIFDGERPKHLEIQISNLLGIHHIVVSIVFIDLQKHRDYFQKRVSALVGMDQAYCVQKFPYHRFDVAITILHYLQQFKQEVYFCLLPHILEQSQ